ncbi:unnamed protein product [Arctogadus glacialis]
MNTISFFPGKMSVNSPAQKHDLEKTSARTVVFQRGGDVSDRQEGMGEYLLQFGKYQGKSFKWLLENDVGYTIYLMKKAHQQQSREEQLCLHQKDLACEISQRLRYRFTCHIFD